jgi:hypothetical protein
MSGNANNSPMLKAAGLWAKTSVKGRQYLTGRLGGVKVLVMENCDRQGDDDPSHHLFLLEAAPRQGGEEREEGLRGAQTPPARQSPSQLHRSGCQRHASSDTEEGPPWEP